jgi:hypothetical protein
VKWKPIFALLALFAFSSCEADPLDIGELVRSAVANHLQRERLRNDYTYLARVRWTDFAARGRSKPQYTETYDIVFLEGAPYAKHIAHNGQPLPPSQERLEQALFEAEAKARRAGTSNQPGRPAEYDPGPKSTWTFEHLTTEFNLLGKGMGTLNGHRVYIVQALPKEKPAHLATAQDHARYFKTRLWIDVAERQIVRAREELIEDSLVMIEPGLTWAYPIEPEKPQIFETGSRHITYARGNVFDIQWTKVNGEVWLPQRTYSHGKGRVTFDRSTGEISPPHDFQRDMETTYSEYKKFRVKSRIVP